MPQVQPTYPGIYVEELPQQTHTVQEASTSATAFVDFFSRGSMARAVQITSWRQFEQTFGGLDHRSEASYGIYQYFNNGGQTAWVVRVGNGAKLAQTLIKVKEPTLDQLKDDATTYANDAKEAAQQAEQDAQTAATQAADPAGDPATATQEVAQSTQSVAVDTAKAGVAAGSAGALLSGAIQIFDAKHGPLAAETLVAANEAAQAADAASTAAGIAEATATAAATIGDQLNAGTAPTADDYKSSATAAQGAVGAVPAEATKAQTDADAAVAAAQKATDPSVASTADDDVAPYLDQAALLSNQLQTQMDAAVNAVNAAKAAADAAVPQSPPVPGFREDAASATSLTETMDAIGALQTALSTAEQLSNQMTAANLLVASDSGASADLKSDIGASVTANTTAVSSIEAALNGMITALPSVLTAAGDASAGQVVLAAQTAALNATKAAKSAAVAAANAQQIASQDAAAAAGSHLTVLAANPGTWGNDLHVVAVDRPNDLFDLLVKETAQQAGRTVVVNSEDYRGVTLTDANSPKYAPKVVNHASALIRLEFTGPAIPGTQPEGPTQAPSSVQSYHQLQGGADGGLANPSQLVSGMEEKLDKIAPNIFNILCLPAVANFSTGGAKTAYDQALQYCSQKRAFLIADIPETTTSTQDMLQWIQTFGNETAYNGAVYFPRLTIPDPLTNYRPKNVAPSGTLAGLFASNDTTFGVWKSPAGIDAVLQNADLVTNLSDTDTGDLNTRGVNVLRSFAVYGNVVWGARTLAGADLLDSQWKYVSVRRTADFIEDSLVQSLKWVVFENNDERLWAQIRAEVSTFMAGLFADGAFAGASADQAYLVKCDSTTTTPTDIAQGIVNIVIGFAPERPAEFVILKLMQLTAS